ncbi:MAG: bifunctional glutathionylspermidine amidase/synthase [Gammaproteobacteria bacterium]|nr:bifunctional glutathionylspermidine amidase/synthase [Gammaproteobacteria bacterium]
MTTSKNLKNSKKKTKQPEKFGTLLGLAPGNVEVYSSDYDNMELLCNRQSLRNYVDGIFMGYKWQCVEFARRWMYLNYGYVFDDISMAYDIFNLKTVRNIHTSEILPLKSFRNGSKRRPEPGCMLIWAEGGEFQVTGHVSIITEVSNDCVYIVEQNVDHTIWPNNRNYARELKASTDEYGGFWIACDRHDTEILGWVMQTADSKYAEKPLAINKQLFKVKLNELEDISNHEKSWLNIANDDEAAYVKAMLGHKLVNDSADENKFFCISKTTDQELKHASNELHAMFMHATNLVLQDNNLFEKFSIPKVVWPRIQSSWDNRRNEMITGRFDFSVTTKGIKVYEYNADSSSCYMECGKIQGKWAEHFGCNLGECAGDELTEKLVNIWEDSTVDQTDGLLHIMLDNHPEELYHGLYMKSAIEEAGIKCKIIHGLDGLKWNSENKIVDEDNNELRWVWKTWAWETVLDQIREECDSVSYDKTKPRLVDVLLNDNIIVYEPLWTLIPSNKAILPILWEIYPNHRYLLNSQFNLNEELIQSGYVTKPIAGRCGWNINIFDKNSTLINQTDGRFHKQEQIYQELFPLANIDNKYNVQISTFTVAGSYAGSCARVDKTLVVTTDSEIYPLRIVDDQEILAE